MAVKSGIPTTVNGVQVGATDFSEFTVGAGLPAGITGLSANFAALTVGINDAPISPSFTDEGKYFEILTPITFNAPWAFVIDAFDGLIEQGELLARVLCNFSATQNRRCMGPGMSLTLVPGIDGAGSGFIDAFSSGDVEVSGGRFVNGGVGTIEFFSIQEPLQEDEWMWLRIRKTNNAGIPSNDDWTVTAWYGDIEDEPASPDGITLNNSDGTPRGLFGIGCTYFSPGSSFSQRCAFLSYSENPDVEPPPVPPLGEATIWTPFPEVFTAGAPKPTILGLEIEYDVRVLVLNDGDTVDPWPDSSGQGNDAVPQALTDPSFVEDGWAPGINAVRLQDTALDPQENFLFTAVPAFLNTDVTFFAVFQIDDLSLGAAIIGSKSASTPPRIFTVGVDIDGSIFFNKGFDPRNIVSAPGTIVEGVQYIVSARLDVAGMILRVNGLQVGEDLSNDGQLEIIDWADPRIGQLRDITNPGGEYGVDKLITWIGGYTVAASDEQIVQMESFLSGVFAVPFGTVWTDQPEVSPGTVWANIP